MEITKNTKFYKSNNSNCEVIYRDLNIAEISAVTGIVNKAERQQMAYDIALVKIISGNPTYMDIFQIGSDVIESSLLLMSDFDTFKSYVDELRVSVDNDVVIKYMIDINSILHIPYDKLLKMNYRDIIELVVICEKVIKKPIISYKNKPTKTKEEGSKNYMEDDGKSIQEKMKELEGFIRG